MCIPSWPRTCCVAKDNLGLLILLPLPPERATASVLCADGGGAQAFRHARQAFFQRATVPAFIFYIFFCGSVHLFSGWTVIALLSTEFSCHGKARLPLLVSKLMFASSKSKPPLPCGSKRTERWPVNLCVPAVFHMIGTQVDKEPARASYSPGDPSLTVPRNIKYKDSAPGPSQGQAVPLRMTDFQKRSVTKEQTQIHVHGDTSG